MPLVGFFQTAHKQQRDSSSGTPRRAVLLDAKETLRCFLCRYMQIKMQMSTSSSILSRPEDSANFIKEAARLFPEEHEEFPSCDRGEPGEDSRAAFAARSVSCVLRVRSSSLAGQGRYDPQLTEAETETEGGHVTTQVTQLGSC